MRSRTVTLSAYATKHYPKRGKSPKKYEYKVKYATELHIDDFADLIGIENACKLFVFLANTRIQFPTIKMLKIRLRTAAIRNDIKMMKDKGEKHIHETLSKKYNLSKNVITKIDGHNIRHPDMQIQWNERMHSARIRDERLLEIMKEHWEILARYGLV